MMTRMFPIDATLDEWGSRLFNLAPGPPPRPPKRSTSPASFRASGNGSRLTSSQARAAAVRQKLHDLVRRAPQVMVKLAKAPKGMRGISNNLRYISRNGQLDIEDEDLYRRWITDENCRCPEGESHADVRSRMMRAFERVNSERAVLVAHGTANRIGATALLNLPLMSAMRLAQDNAAMNVFVQRGDHWILKVWNHT